MPDTLQEASRLDHLDEIIGYAKYLLEVNNNKKKKEAT